MSKSKEKAEMYRNKGNVEFLHKNLTEALNLYGQSLLFSPKDTIELCLALGNRSAVLFELHHFEECLRDIERVLVIRDCPTNLQTKLNTRKNKCPAVNNANVKNVKYYNNLPTIQTTNSKMPACSVKCQMKYSDREGRFLVASNDIQPGDVLIVENPYAFVILPHSMDEFCHNCINVLPHDFVPCEFCSEVKFCSESCRETAMSCYHCSECGYLKILYDSGLAHLALRMILFTKLEILAELVCLHIRQNDWSNREGVFGLNLDEIYEQSSYCSVYNFMTNDIYITREDLDVYKTVSRRLVSFLEDCNFLASFMEVLENLLKTDNLVVCNECKTVDGVKTFFQKTILKHVQQLICNAHAITLTSARKSLDSASPIELEEINERKIASGVYPTVSLLNHSCDPNTFSSFVGKTLVVRATKEIKVGEEIFNCYGPRVGKIPMESRRQSLLQQYYFHCQCLICTSAEEMEKERFLTSLICQNCGAILKNFENIDEKFVACGSCSTNFECSNLLSSIRDIEETFYDRMRIGNSKLVENSLENVKKVLYKRNKRFIEISDEAIRFFAENGEFPLASRWLISNIENNEFVYGENSIEVANEILKLTDFLRADINLTIDSNLRKNIVQLGKKAVQIFSIHYGSDCLQIEEISSSIALAEKNLVSVAND